MRECILGILVALPKSAQVTTATPNASAASISLRRYNFAITKETIDTAARIDIDLSRYDIITALAAPLVCSDFQHDFDIVSSSVFKDLGVIIKQGRGHGSKDYLSFCDSPDIKAEMGHRSNGLPTLYLVPDSIVEDNRLRRMQHHSLTPYTDAEGNRLLKEQWQYADSNGVYLAALDECYTTDVANCDETLYANTCQTTTKNTRRWGK